MFPRNFEFSQTSTSVYITVWKHGKCFLFLKDITSCLRRQNNFAYFCYELMDFLGVFFSIAGFYFSCHVAAFISPLWLEISNFLSYYNIKANMLGASTDLCQNAAFSLPLVARDLPTIRRSFSLRCNLVS